MKKIILAATIIGLSVGGALAQGTGPASQNQNDMKTNDTMSRDGMKGGMKRDGAAGTTTGASPQDRATVPGSLNSGGTSPASPNTAQPGSSKTGGSN